MSATLLGKSLSFDHLRDVEILLPPRMNQRKERKGPFNYRKNFASQPERFNQNHPLCQEVTQEGGTVTGNIYLNILLNSNYLT
jgi:hypothetical protein